MVSERNVRERLNTEKKPWPPHQPNNFIPLVVIYHHGNYTPKETIEITQFIHTHDIDEVTSLASNQSILQDHPKLDSHEALHRVPLDRSTVTEELTEILAPLEQSNSPQFVLIEGAPGIGKSVLLKEIAYRWGKKQVLKMFKLVLLICLRDRTLKQAVSVSDLLERFCEGNRRAAQIAAACHDHLSGNGGKDVMFLFDGFDELQAELQEDSLIAKILDRDRELLPKCTLIVSSRPHATVHLRKMATVKIDILGFSEVQRNQFIQQALEEQPQSSKELIQYLEDHITISSLCAVPFNMVVLLYLYKLEVPLPNNSTELYNRFICHTIYRYLAKNGHWHSLKYITANLTNLPYPYDVIIQQLSKFSLKALNENMLVFTFDEIKEACQDIISIPGAINGFGLLKAVEHCDIDGNGITTTFNFLHFTIQEFLAALHVANLPPRDELKILREKFWSDIHSNMFSMYIAYTKGQRPSFKQFIKPSLAQRFKGFITGSQVANRFFDNQLKCFRLFRCFFEAGDNAACRSIENAAIFNSKTIVMNNQQLLFSRSLHNNNNTFFSSDTTLSPSDVFISYNTTVTLSSSDVVCLTMFLTCSSHKEWRKLDLNRCIIQDQGVQILHRELTRCNLTITRLDLSDNGLTELCSPAIIGIITSFRVKELKIDGNDINICESEKFISIISDPSSTLVRLSIAKAKLSSLGAINLFIALSKVTCKLTHVDISYNNDLSITDDVCRAMVMALKKNIYLAVLNISGNPTSKEHMQLIIQALQHNKTLQQLIIKFTEKGIREFFNFMFINIKDFRIVH